MNDALVTRVERAIEERVFPGCVVGLLERNGGRRVFPFGRYTYDPGSTRVTERTRYDCASVTKSVVTATLALQLIDEGRLAVDEKIIGHIPEYRTAHRDAVTVQHLFTYTLGNVRPLSRLAATTPNGIFEAVCTEETGPPGLNFSYSNTPAFLLGIIIERILGIPLDEAAQERIFDPLRMRSSNFKAYGAAPTEGGVRDIVHDESARVFAREGKAVGHAGLFSTAPDLLVFLAHILAHPDPRLTTNYLSGASAALGWELDQPWMGELRTSRTFGKTGFTGTALMCDYERDVGLVILSNRTYPRRPPDASAMSQFRADLCDIVFTCPVTR